MRTDRFGVRISTGDIFFGDFGVVPRGGVLATDEPS
jgi:hypothetical protein